MWFWKTFFVICTFIFGNHIMLCVCVKSLQLFLTLCNAMDYSLSGFSVHGKNAPGKNTGVGYHALLQGIF